MILLAIFLRIDNFFGKAEIVIPTLVQNNRKRVLKKPYLYIFSFNANSVQLRIFSIIHINKLVGNVYDNIENYILVFNKHFKSEIYI